MFIRLHRAGKNCIPVYHEGLRRPRMKALWQLVAIIFPTLSLPAADWPQWRGPRRTGISQETGLLKEWPQDGPKQLWRQGDIGDGYATPSVVGSRLYLLSNRGMENEFVQALSVEDGKPV